MIEIQFSFIHTAQIIRTEEDLKKYEKQNVVSVNREKTFPNEDYILKTDDKQDSMKVFPKKEEVEEGIHSKPEDESNDKKISEVNDAKPVKKDVFKVEKSFLHNFLFSFVEISVKLHK